MPGEEEAHNTPSSQFDAQSVAEYWLTEAEESLRVAEHLVEKADYSYALFFGHLAVEKSLKALYALRFKEHAPPIHNLLRLARAVGLELDEARADALIRITAFNIEARYPDMKRDFRRACTPEYTAHQMAAIKEILEWLQSQQV
jgi:HEPN domain-containing protein